MIPWRPVLSGDAAGAEDELVPFAVRRRSPAWRSVAEVPLLILLAIGIVFPVKTFVAQAFFIPSGSMIPQLEVGDRVLVSKLSYRLHEPRRGDVVVFENPGGSPPPDESLLPVRVVRGLLEAAGLRQPRSEDFIKRVIAFPGEVFEVRDGTVVIDGRELVEPYLPDGTSMDDRGPILVPEGTLWVMGDNRSHSSDSRQFGPIDRDTVVGRAILLIWPPRRAAFL